MNYNYNDNFYNYFSDYPKPLRHMGVPAYVKDANRATVNPPMSSQPKTTLNLFTVDEAFFNGTIFRGLYQPYKNYQPRKVIPTTEREKLLFDVNKYYFALHEIRLYLNAYPTDQEAINVFTEFQKEYIKAKNAYESKYGALDIEAPNLNTSPWNWTVGRWPWESEK